MRYNVAASTKKFNTCACSIKVVCFIKNSDKPGGAGEVVYLTDGQFSHDCYALVITRSGD
jgi:hypothetical protein